MKRKFCLLLLMIFIVPLGFAKSGSMKLLAVSNSEVNPVGGTVDLYLEIKEGTGRVFIDSFPLSKLDTQISTRFAKEVACNFIERDCTGYDFFFTIRSNSPIVGGPSASAAIAVLTISVLDDLPIDKSISITGTINTGGIIGPVGGILPKIEAASTAGIKKVLIPKYTGINGSNITDLEVNHGIKVVEVSQLTEAIKEFTGKDYSSDENVNLSSDYVKTMKSIADELCKRAEILYSEANIKEINNSAQKLLEKGLESISREEHYSAASFCFGSGLNSRYQKLLKDNLNEDQLKDKIEETIDRVSEFKNFTDKKELKTITDLEAFMVVSDRVSEARNHLNDALFNLATNKTNASLYELAYGIERLNSAHSWSVFFGRKGSAFNINKKVIEASCLKKISEVEERIEYIDLYLPAATEDARLAVKQSYDSYNSGSPEICLHKASIAKAKVDLVLNTIALNEEDLDIIINDRASIVKSIISKQSKRDIFPILAYSYYEYANSLKESDKFSAMLYLEYALELGNLDIYFEKQKIKFPKIEFEYYLVFLSGLLIGVMSGILIVRLSKANKMRQSGR